MRFAVLGRTHWLLAAARQAMAAGHELVFVATARAAAEYQVTDADFEALASDAGCPYVCGVQWTADQVGTFGRSGADIGLSVNWPTLLPAEILDVCPWGIANAHAGDLPRFRGNACPNWAILADESKVVLTIHRMVLALDAGPIYAQRSLRLTPHTYIRDVYSFLDEAIPQLFVEVMELIAAERLVPRPQSVDAGDALRCHPRRPGDAELDWRLPARELDKLVRASSDPFAGAFTWFDGERLTVWQAHHEALTEAALGIPGQVIDRRADEGTVTVLAGEGALVLERVTLGDQERVPAARVVRSTRSRLGLNVSAELERLRRQVALLERRLEK